MTSLKSSATARHMSIISEDTAAIHPPSNDSFPSTPQPTDWWADRHSIFLLIALYAAQGLPIGLAFGSIPFLLKERGSSYADLAQFSFATLPYSLKLFIAPIVDTFYHPSFGRRKSWIVPVQLAIGAVTLIFSDKIQNWVNAGDVSSLLPVFFFIISLTATQDIAVDGWSLTMLKKANVSYASTCQSLGITIGYFATFTIFLALSNASFCDTYARPLLFLSSTSGPLADLRLVLRSAGLYYFCLTFYITFFKHEQPDVSFSKKNDDDTELLSLQLSGSHMVEDAEETLSVEQSSRSKTFDSIASTYSDLLVVIRLPAVQNLVFALLIAKLGFSAYDNGTFAICSTSYPCIKSVF